ncbi:hypothetical protein OH76DRAFT_1099601 [Lentinus brumalis]|uniref:Uncharacterized protein n=1 Tax=Lentinus brumalis TaxID=2498619 RepID=A0A371CVV6_9APHY|nr:hypothetical protein OH76DRAFT_1099601 [Polyporus brumalis]
MRRLSLWPWYSGCSLANQPRRPALSEGRRGARHCAHDVHVEASSTGGALRLDGFPTRDAAVRPSIRIGLHVPGVWMSRTDGHRACTAAERLSARRTYRGRDSLPPAYIVQNLICTCTTTVTAWELDAPAYVLYVVHRWRGGYGAKRAASDGHCAGCVVSSQLRITISPSSELRSHRWRETRPRVRSAVRRRQTSRREGKRRERAKHPDELS